MTAEQGTYLISPALARDATDSAYSYQEALDKALHLATVHRTAYRVRMADGRKLPDGNEDVVVYASRHNELNELDEERGFRRANRED